VKTFLVKVVIGVILGWITSVLERIRLERQAKEEGKKEVLETLEKKEKEIDKKLEEANKAGANTAFDDAIRELLDSASDAGSDKMHSSKKPHGGDSAKASGSKTS
jgi:predicted RNA-binding protein with PUA domain